MSFALLAVAGCFLVGASIISPIFAAWATLSRLRSRTLLPKQRAVDLAIFFLALVGPLLWFTWFTLLPHHKSSKVAVFLVPAAILCGLASLLLALLGRGSGRTPVLAAHVVTFALVICLFLWAVISVHHHGGEAFIGQLRSSVNDRHLLTP